MTARFLHLCPERRKGLLFSLGALGRLQLKGLKTLAAFLEIIIAVVLFAACPLTALLPSHLPRLPSGEFPSVTLLCFLVRLALLVLHP